MIGASTEQDVKAGDGSLKGEVPCATVCIKVQLFLILSKHKIYVSSSKKQ